jgi:c-di-GMP-related signal transduction protein
LLERKGQLGEVLKLIFAYEHADWHNTSLIMVRNGIDIEVLTKAFLDSLVWYRQLLDAIEDEEELERTAEFE